jgi:hypothetical protein
MTIKKLNAVIALITSLALFVHIGYSAFAYLTFYYNPTLKVVTAIPFMVCTCIHAILGMCAVFLMGDGTRLTVYPRLNARTLIQRITAALIFPMLILHLNTFRLLKNNAASGNWPVFAIIIFIQIIFFAVVITHTAVSFSRALITLGMLQSRQAQTIIDRIVYIFWAAVFLIASFAVTRGDIVMFVLK